MRLDRRLRAAMNLPAAEPGFPCLRVADTLEGMRAVLLCVALLALTSLGPSVDSVRRGLEARYRGAKTLKAIFFESYSDGSGQAMAESGTVYFSRPGRMRWEYRSPQEKLFLVDGTNAWFYVPADHTASRAKIKESADWRTPLALLAGKADLSQVCRQLESVRPETASHADDKPLSASDALLRCIPRGDSGAAVPVVLLEVDSDARLVRVVIRQAGNVETEFRFGNWEENLPIPEEKFHFQPPPGVTIVDEQSLADQIH
jgi:outer membrane lipoprotein carrier protein